MIDRKIALKQLKLLDSKGREMRLAAEGWKNDWQILVAILLSARTRDETVILVCEKMFSEFPTPQKFSRLQISDIRRLIGSINFFNNKSKMLYDLTERLIQEYKGKVPESIDDLITLSGVGRKTANVFLGVKGGSHIGVDTHVTYISNYLGWVKTKDPVKIEKALEELFPKSKWNQISHILIRFGKTYISKTKRNMWLDWIIEKTA